MHTGEVAIEVLHPVESMVSGGTARNPTKEWTLPVGVDCTHSCVPLCALLHPEQLTAVRAVEPLIHLRCIHPMVGPIVLLHTLYAGIHFTTVRGGHLSSLHTGTGVSAQHPSAGQHLTTLLTKRISPLCAPLCASSTCGVS